LPVPEVQELLSSSVDKIEAEVTSLEEKISELNDEMQDLKTALYGRFGRSINLEA
jgi:prefoldin subunit 4